MSLCRPIDGMTYHLLYDQWPDTIEAGIELISIVFVSITAKFNPIIKHDNTGISCCSAWQRTHNVSFSFGDGRAGCERPRWSCFLPDRACSGLIKLESIGMLWLVDGRFLVRGIIDLE